MLTFLSAFLLCTATSADGAPRTVISNVNVITMDDKGTVVPGASLLIEDGVVKALLRHTDAVPSGVRTIDGHGGWLIPGLIDSHVHYDEPSELTSYLRHGVTTVLSLGREDAGMASFPTVTAAIAAGKLAGPKVYATGPIIANQVELADAAAAKAFVQREAAAGYGFVKIYNGTTRPIFDAVVAETRRLGMGVFGHMPRTMSPEYVVSHGLNVLAHMEELFFTTLGGPSDEDLPALTPDWKPDLSKVDALFDLMKAHHVAIIPNLIASFGFAQLWVDPESVFSSPEAAYLEPADVKEWRGGHFATRSQIDKRMLRERLKLPLLYALTWQAKKKGILLVAGTDSPLPPLFPGHSLHEELRLLVSTGLTPTESLATATRNAGQLVRSFVDHNACIGEIRPGCEADLLLLTADPRTDIRNVDRIAGVMSDGRWYTPPELLPKVH